MELKNITNEQKRIYIIAAIIVIVILAFAISMYRAGKYIPDNTIGVNRITCNLRQTTDNIKQADEQLKIVGAGIVGSQAGVSTVQGRLEQSTNRIDSIVESQRGSKELAQESLELSKRTGTILRRISERNGTKNN